MKTKITLSIFMCSFYFVSAQYSDCINAFEVCEVDTVIQVEIFDMIGRKISTFELNGQNSIDLSRFADGTYFLNFTKDGQLIQTEKIVKI